MSEPGKLVEHFFRHESARLVAALTRVFGARHLGLAEDVVQAALARALSSWSRKGIPPEPRAWLCRVARNLAIDTLRRDLRWNSLKFQGDPPAPSLVSSTFLNGDEDELNDDLLRMIFVCCDDAVPAESQVALALKTLCGFEVREIAHALLTSEGNITRRITRAKDRLRQAGLDPGALTPTLIAARLPNVRSIIYLLFNEGYSASQPVQLIRVELCEEACRLALLLAEHPLTRGSTSSAFLALLLFHSCRLNSRVDDRGMLLLLEEQDRTLWDRALMAEAFRWFARSGAGDELTRYHAEAWVASEHCAAPRFQDTNWERIVRAYDLLIRLAPSPIHELNRAIAVAERDGAEAGWRALQAIEVDRLPEHYHFWAAAAGELSRRRGAVEEARKYLAEALKLAPTQAERVFLKGRLESI